MEKFAPKRVFFTSKRGQMLTNPKSLALAMGIASFLLVSVPIFPISLALPIVSAQPATLELSPSQLNKLARSITVKILSGDSGGSGILIKKTGQVYTVLTNQHVLARRKPTRIQTPDGHFHPAKLVTGINFQGKDLALLQFNSSADYAVASLTNLATVAVNDPIFAAGFPFEADSSQPGGFILTQGQVLYVPKRAFKEGYQIGYSNNIEKGMSGGAILNREGQVIGINGIHADPLWGDPYVYEDGSPLTEAERDLMSRYSWGIPIQTFAQLAPQYASKEALAVGTPTATEENLPPIANDVNNMAQQITVQIDVPNTSYCKGSGVIIAKQGNIYTVLTAEHVIRETEECDRKKLEIITPNNQRYLVDVNENTVKTLPGVDLAVLKFTSKLSYRVATLARHDLEKKGGLVFVSGLPGSTVANGKKNRLFTIGTLFNKEWGSISVKDSLSLTYGYGLVYTNITEAGVSGGPVLDIRGHVIGIHGRADGEAVVDEAGSGRSMHLGYSLGVPINTFLSLVTKVGIEPTQLRIYAAEPPSLTESETQSIKLSLLERVQKPSNSNDAISWLNYGNQLWRLEKYEEALAAFDRAIKIKSDFYQAWYSRGQVFLYLEKYSEALEAFEKAIQESQGKFALSWRGKSLALINLQRYLEALTSIEKAISLSPNDFLVLVYQGILLQTQERYQEAIMAYDKAIKINPHPWAYNNRSFVRAKLGDKEGALADVNKALEINPDYAESYLQRSSIRSEWGDKEGTLADVNKALEIDPNYADAYFSRGIHLYYFGNRSEGIADLGKAIKLNPKNAFFYYKWGGLYSNEGDNQEAIIDYNRAIQLNPNFAEAYYDRGLAHGKLGDRQAAIANFQKAAELYQQQGNTFFSQQALARITELQSLPSAIEPATVALYEGAALNITHQVGGKVSIQIVEIDSSSRKVQVRIAFSKGLYGEGVFEGIINQNNVLELSGILGTLQAAGFPNTDVRLEFLPNETIKGTYSIYADVHNVRGRTQNGEFTASKIQRNSEKTSPASHENAEIYFNRGYVHHNQGDYTKAITNYTEAIRLKPDYVEAYLRRGIARAQKNDFLEAIKDLNQVLILEPELLQAFYIRGLIYASLKNYQKAIDDYNHVLPSQKIVGIGVKVEINSKTKVVTIVSVIDHSSAQKQGIKAGDQILEIDGKLTTNISLEDVVTLLRGQKGTNVTVRTSSPEKKERKVTLIRELIVDPQLAEVYYNRGLARLEMKDKKGAREDLRKAADLYKLQNNTEIYSKVLQKLKEIQ